MKSCGLIRHLEIKRPARLLVGLLLFVLGSSLSAAPTGAQAGLRIHCGGEPYISSTGDVWQADSHYDGGSAVASDVPITGTADPELYRSMRCDGRCFHYVLPAGPGTYLLWLHFAEGDSAVTAGTRLFNVFANGLPLLNNFDVYAAAGGLGKPVDECFPVTVPAGGTGVVLTFQAVSCGAMVSAIELVPALKTDVSPPPTVEPDRAVSAHPPAPSRTKTQPAAETRSVAANAGLARKASSTSAGTAAFTMASANLRECFQQFATYIPSNNAYAQWICPGNTCTIPFTGTSVTINFDTSPEMAAGIPLNFYPALEYSVDNSPWTAYTETPNLTVSGLTPGNHTIALAYVLNNEGYDIWTNPSECVRFASVVLDADGTITPPSLPAKTLCLHSDSTGRSAWNDYVTYSDADGTFTWAYYAAQALNAFFGNCSFSHQGWDQGGTPASNIPAFYTPGSESGTTYDQYCSGISRLSNGAFLSDCDYHLICEGQNGTTTAAQVQAFLADYQAHTANDIFILVPFSGANRTPITAGFNAYQAAKTDGKCFLIDLHIDDWYVSPSSATRYSGDKVHPNKWAHAQIGALVARAIQKDVSEASGGNVEPPPVPPSGLTATPGDGQVALSWTASAGATGYNVKRSATSGGPYTTVSTAGSVTGTTYTDTGLSNGTTYYYVITAVNSGGESGNSNEASATPSTVVPGTTTLRINAGGGAYTSATLGAFQGDTDFNGGNTWSFQDLAITGTNDPELYRDVRYSSGSFSYTLPAAPGSYTLRLHFVEGDASATTGRRVFNVLVNGAAALNNLDVYARAGYGRALDVSLPVTAPAGGGGVTVTFQTLSYGAMVSALELVPAGS